MSDIPRISLQPDGAGSLTEPLFLSTDSVPQRDRQAWLVEEIGRQYAAVEITAPKDVELFNEMRIYPWGESRFSIVRSNPIRLERPANPRLHLQTDAFFVVLLLSGEYCLDQGGREVYLRSGDISMYDARRPHRINCPNRFSKIVIKVPGPLLRLRLPHIEHCTALKISGQGGLGAIVSEFLKQSARSIDHLGSRELLKLGDFTLDLLAMAFNVRRPGKLQLSRTRSSSLETIKVYVEMHLLDPDLNTRKIEHGTGFCARYINELFNQEGTSLMRYVWSRRIDQCRIALGDPDCKGMTIIEIAHRWCFNDPAHFSRAFKQKCGMSPSAYRSQQ